MKDQEKQMEIVKLYQQFTDALKAHNIKPRGAVTLFIAFAAQTVQCQNETWQSQSGSFKTVAQIAMDLHGKAKAEEAKNPDPSKN